jgi:hypothetical protein
VVLAGTHPVSVDCVAATLMGFEWRSLKVIERAFALQHLNFVPFGADEIEVVSSESAWAGPVEGMNHTFSFRPHFGWVGAIESHRQAMAM